MADNEFAEIPLAKITSWCEQERRNFAPESMAGLTASIRTFGVLEPIGVIRDGEGFKGWWGQRRFLAAKAAGRTTIPALIQEKPRAETDAVELRLSENIQREALNPIELATGLGTLVKAGGKTASEVAQRLGMSVASVSRSLRLLDLPLPIQQQVARGEISAATAYELAQIPDEARRTELAAQAAAGKLTRDAISGRRKVAARAPVENQSTSPSRVTVKLGAGRSLTACTPNLDMEGFITFLEEVLGRARRSRDLSLATFIQVMADQARQ